MYNLLIIGIFEGLFLASLILTKKNKTKSDYILAIYFVLFGLNIFFSYMEAYNRNNNFSFPFFIMTSAPLLLLQGPTMWLYVKSLTQQHFKFKFSYFIHLIPFVLIVLQHCLQFYSLSNAEKIHILQTDSFKTNIFYPIFIVIIAVLPVFYYSWSLYLVNNYKKQIKNYFSQTQNIDLHWLKILLISWIVLNIGINTFFVIDLFLPIAPFGLMQMLSFLVASVYVVFLGFYGRRHQNIFSSVAITITTENTVSKTIDSQKLQDKEKVFVTQLLNFMKNDKPFLNPELTLKGLSELLKVNPDYLSEITNDTLNMNFFDFVNHYRIEEFKERILNEKYKNLTIIAIAFDCGFNSKPTFNRVFKKATGLTPSEFIKQYQ